MLNYLALSAVIGLVAAIPPSLSPQGTLEGEPAELLGMEMDTVKERIAKQCEYLFKLHVWNPCPCVDREKRKRQGGCLKTDTCCNWSSKGQWEYRKWICAQDSENYRTSSLFNNFQNVAQNEKVASQGCQLWVDGPLPTPGLLRGSGRMWLKAGFCSASRQNKGQDTVACVMERLQKKLRTGEAIQLYWVCTDTCYYDMHPYDRQGFLPPQQGQVINPAGVPNPDDYAPWNKPPTSLAVIGLLGVAGGLAYWMRKKNEPDYQALLTETV